MGTSAYAAPRIVVVHDYLTQRGGAERVVLALMRAFPDARLVTSLYNPESTYPEFLQYKVETLSINRFAAFRTNHKLALPFLASAFDSAGITDCDLVLCSSSGWAHGVSTNAPKLVYSHNPPRWLYQADDYFRDQSWLAKIFLKLLRPRLERWDRKSAEGADAYVVNSTAVAKRVLDTYGRTADVLHPPVSLDCHGPQSAVTGLAPGFFLSIARGRGYKHVDIVEQSAIEAGARLVVVGSDPSTDGHPNVKHLGRVSDPELRWLYANASYLVGAAHEDFGLTPIEANSFGTPALVLRSGGYLETVREGINGFFFDELSVPCLARAMRIALERDFDESEVLAVAAHFSEKQFGIALRERVFDLVA